ncbi:CaiB/BaiF CoA-transferase family protein [Frankia umida]|uniref:CaiB/BaiF CoA-transferase family protein n=1 Tax=Frankia umida TaxID=573489 RepID=UPI00200E75DA|nr:CoA transferase [Frankia umida]
MAGWRVLEVGESVAVSFCTRLLADLGAEVVMVEPPSGHVLRAAEPRTAAGVSARFVYLSAGKRSVIRPVGEGILELAAAADLLVTDLAPARLDPLAARIPDTAVVSVRPFGATGPSSGHQAHHLTLFHASGEGSTLPSGLGWQRFPDRAPIQLGSELGYFDAGWNAAIAALAACWDASRRPAARTAAGGRARERVSAQRVDVSVQESLLTLNRTRLNRFLNDGILVGRERSRYPVGGMQRCQDGWIQAVGLRDEHWDRLLATPQGAEFRAAGFDTAQARAADVAGLQKALTAWCEARPKHEAARLLAAVGAPAGIFAEPTDLLEDEQLAHRDFFRDVGVDDGDGGHLRIPGAPYRFSASALPVRPAPRLGSSTGFEPRESRQPRQPRESRGSHLPAQSNRPGEGRLLDGVRVLDFTWAAAGPYATLLLGFLGAEIIKVESTRRPDLARYGFLARYDTLEASPIFNELNLNKRSLRLDLTQPDALALARRLAGEVDVVVDNFRPGVMARLGLGADVLLDLNPRLVVASSSANGSTGPLATGAGLASIFSATGGLSVQSGYPDGPPTDVGDPVDYRSGAALAVGILAALLDRDRTGRGQHLDLSSREVVIASAPDAVLAHVAGVPWRQRRGNGHHTMTPHGVHPCHPTAGEDGWLALAVGDEAQWSALCAVLGRDDWPTALSTPAARRAAADEIDEAIRAWTHPRTAAEAAASLQAAGVPAEPVMTFADLATDPHLAAREAFVEVDHPVLGRQWVLRPPWHFSAGGRGGTGGGEVRPGPVLGADTETILARYTDREVAQ